MKKITVIGGDNRSLILKENLSKKFTVDSLGLCENDSGDIATSQFLVLPIPTTKDGINVYTPLSKKIIPLSYIYENTPQNTLILSCNYAFNSKNYIDYGSLDSFSLLNAVPTAEGAIKIAIENTRFTLWRAKVLVIGYGRVGKILSERLKALGARVTVSARKSYDKAMIEALGFSCINTGELKLKRLSYDIVFNTVDVKVIEDECFKNADTSLLIDLSSKGGFNTEAAEAKCIKALKAPGLPNITAPETAAEILCKTVNDIINEGETDGKY